MLAVCGVPPNGFTVRREGAVLLDTGFSNSVVVREIRAGGTVGGARAVADLLTNSQMRGRVAP